MFVVIVLGVMITVSRNFKCPVTRKWLKRNCFARCALSLQTRNTEIHGGDMPILLWLLGVPLSLIVVLMLFGIF
jgi:hypothetical protein